MGIAQQLEPYIKSITSLMEQIQPEVGGSAIQTQSEQEPVVSTSTTKAPNYSHRQYTTETTVTTQAPAQLPERIQTAVSLAEYKSRLITFIVFCPSAH